MIAVETIIRKLVAEYEFVIIPGFGALLSHQIPAAYDEVSLTFAPPAKKLAFNEFLKLDDGLLANYISRNERLSHQEAVDIVKGYTDKLRINLENSGQAEIVGIGEFRKNVEGKLVFEPNTGKYFKDEWFGFEKIKARRFEKAANTVSLGNTYIEDETIEVLDHEVAAVNPFRWGRWAAAAAIAAILCAFSLFLVNSESGDIKSTLNPFTELFSKSTTESYDHFKTVAVPEELIDVKAVEVPATPDSVSGNEVPSEVVKAEPVIAEAVQPAAIAPSVVKTPAEAKFYVIAGTFKGMRAARVLVEELKAQGFEDAGILAPDRVGKKVKVSVNGYDNETDAYRASAKLKTVIGEAGWVYQRK